MPSSVEVKVTRRSVTQSLVDLTASHNFARTVHSSDRRSEHDGGRGRPTSETPRGWKRGSGRPNNGVEFHRPNSGGDPGRIFILQKWMSPSSSISPNIIELPMETPPDGRRRSQAAHFVERCSQRFHGVCYGGMARFMPLHSTNLPNQRNSIVDFTVLQRLTGRFRLSPVETMPTRRRR